MASTNRTTHYDLSQYVANDKPTYLVDYNQDMSKIDAGIYSAESKALVNEGAIGDITELETTVKTDLVSAINEVKGEADDNKGDITTLNTSVSANTGNIGTMANLTTTDKTNLVNAINEVKGDIPTVSDSILNTYSTSTTDTYSSDYINDYVIILTATASKTLNAGEDSYISATVPSTPSGYTSLGGFISNWNGSQDTSQIMVGGGGGSAHVRNYASVSQDVNVTFTFIYVKSNPNI